ncbi:MAG: TonB-dependent receptor domain-containing protein [Gemmatimonadota bacterium]
MASFLVRTRWWPSCLALLLLLLARPLAAQDGGVSGTVTDATTGTALSAVQVEVRRSDGSVVAGAFTAGNGAYRIDGVPAGTYTVAFTLPGWELRAQGGVEVTAGQTTTVSAELVERAYNLNPITVTASKTEEKVLDAPADVEVVSTRDIAERTAVTIADHVKEVAGVDVVTTGLQGSYIVARGFNNIFSGATLTLTDNRIARVPSLRANISHLNPTTSSDLERIEVVLGPGSALYGPNAANGVIHSLTKSPIDYPGVTFSIANGLRQQDTGPGFGSSDEHVFYGEGRIAVKTDDDRFGFKLSGLYFNGRDYAFTDSTELSQQTLANVCINGTPTAPGFDPTSPACQNFAEGLILTNPADLATLQQSVENVANGRDTDLERWTLDGRADIRPSEDASIVFSGGVTKAVNSIDLTGLGAAQVVNWKYFYGQTRVRYKDFFAQAFFNKSDNDETYLLRSGRPLIDKSSLFVGQLQQALRTSDRQRFIFGADLLRTTPSTDGTINGQNESDDEITEVGGYVQSETSLSDQLEFVAAARVDNHDRLKDPVFSPRAALVYKPNEENSLRVTYNRAFSTPTTLNLFLDISGGSVPLGGPFRYDIRAQGTTEGGLTFQRTGGVPDHMSPFAPLLGRSPHELLPTSTGQLWAEAVAAVSAGDPTGQAGALLGLVAPPTSTDISIVAATLNLETQGFDPLAGGLSSIEDIPVLDPTITQTVEVGYKGLIGDKVLLAANGYYTRINDFVSALRLSTPNVFLNGSQVGAYLTSQFLPLVGIAFPDAATATATAAQLAGSIGGIPLGAITPTNAGGNESTLILTYRNLGDINVYGGDLSLTVLLNDQWELNGSAAFVDKEEFDSGTETVPLNAPSAKGALSLSYRNDDVGFNAHARSRFIDGFPVNSGVFVGNVDAYAVFDLSVGYGIPGFPGLTAQLDVQNLFDNGYHTFPGTPDLGRFSLLRLVYTH